MNFRLNQVASDQNRMEALAFDGCRSLRCFSTSTVDGRWRGISARLYVSDDNVFHSPYRLLIRCLCVSAVKRGTFECCERKKTWWSKSQSACKPKYEEGGFWLANHEIGWKIGSECWSKRWRMVTKPESCTQRRERIAPSLKQLAAAGVLPDRNFISHINSDFNETESLNACSNVPLLIPSTHLSQELVIWRVPVQHTRWKPLLAAPSKVSSILVFVDNSRFVVSFQRRKLLCVL